ncbi:hypothetical protein CAOG_005530 [Capsaspora owczarzaki ATCC 30864]|uniref:Protein root UVB sensitive/RUS domain-containing protein n=2 Tax=Capsaspora owczarzaki (strain ATCC 30864) TaxID=595528 RepID=A0A0D2WSA8_CAPO3|nr:hypothetical protein CAOG_005530 [Capsaspora owczarzaki ATCC 30864]
MRLHCSNALALRLASSSSVLTRQQHAFKSSRSHSQMTSNNKAAIASSGITTSPSSSAPTITTTTTAAATGQAELAVLQQRIPNKKQRWVALTIAQPDASRPFAQWSTPSDGPTEHSSSRKQPSSAVDDHRLDAAAACQTNPSASSEGRRLDDEQHHEAAHRRKSMSMLHVRQTQSPSAASGNEEIKQEIVDTFAASTAPPAQRQQLMYTQSPVVSPEAAPLQDAKVVEPLPQHSQSDQTSTTTAAAADTSLRFRAPPLLLGKVDAVSFTGQSFAERWDPEASSTSTETRSAAPVGSGIFALVASLQNAGQRAWRLREDTRHRLIEAFLPKGYPHSVTPNYMGYSRWQAVQSVTGTMTGVLSTQALLYAVGLGAGAIPLAGALNWIVKDGLGQLGGVVYSTFISSKFDSDPKRHRFWSNAALQASTLLEILTPLAPGMFLFLASVSNIGKNISWLAASSTRAQMHNSLTLRDNLGDVTGKAGSQAIATSLIGTGLGIAIAPFVGTDPIAVLLAFLPLSIVNMVSNYRSNTIVHMRTLNVQRAERLFMHFLLHNRAALIDAAAADKMAFSTPMQYQLLTPSQVSGAESFVWHYRTIFDVPVCVEPPIDVVFAKHDATASSSATTGKATANTPLYEPKRLLERLRKALGRSPPAQLPIDSCAVSLLLGDVWMLGRENYLLAVMDATQHEGGMLAALDIAYQTPSFSLLPSDTPPTAIPPPPSNASESLQTEQAGTPPSLQRRRTVCLWFREGTTSNEMVTGFLHACLLRYAMEDPDVRAAFLGASVAASSGTTDANTVLPAAHAEQIRSMVISSRQPTATDAQQLESEANALLEEVVLSRVSHSIVRTISPNFSAALAKSGWRTKNVFLAEGDARLVTD